MLWLHAVAVPVFALATGHGIGRAMLETSPLVVAALVAGWGRLGRLAQSGAATVGLLSASAAVVDLSGGNAEAHFHFFVVILLLSVYQHWLPFALAIAYVTVHHGVIGVLNPDAVFDEPDAIAHPLKWTGIHAAYVVAACAAAVFAWRLTEAEQARRANVQIITDAVLAQFPAERLLDEILLRVRQVTGAHVAGLSLLTEHRRLIVRTVLGADMPDGPLFIEPGGVEDRIATSNTPLALDEIEAEAVLNPLYRELGIQSYAGVPLRLEGNTIGLLDIGMRSAHHFTQAEVDLLQLAADRLAPAIDRAKASDRDRRIAQTLQRSLLSARFPEFPGMDLAVDYRPAGEGVEAGGDLYDAFNLSGGRFALAMGDVAGRGTGAAAIMGQLRIGVRAYAAEDIGPREVVRRVDCLLASLTRKAMVTLAYVEVDPEQETLRYVLAGHPPPLLLGSDGSARFLTEGRCPPLGFALADSPTEGSAPFVVGSALLLYTDGLIEIRNAPLEDRMEELRKFTEQRAGETARELCADILGGMLPDSPVEDDAALLALRRPTSVAARPVAERDHDRAKQGAPVP